jgi:hypothetical protein
VRASGFEKPLAIRVSVTPPATSAGTGTAEGLDATARHAAVAAKATSAPHVHGRVMGSRVPEPARRGK